MISIRSRAVALVAVVALSAGVAGCGSSSGGTPGTSSTKTGGGSDTKAPSAKELYARARTTALGAKSAHVKGTVTDSGQTISIDLAGAVDGSNQEMAVDLGAAGTMTILTVAKKTYMKGDTTFWTQSAGAAAATMFKGKWVLASATQAASLGDTNLKSLLSGMFADESISTLDSLTTGVDTGSVGGVDAYLLSDKLDKGNEIAVSADGKAHLLRLRSTGSSKGELVFTEWDSVKTFAAPKASEIVTM